MPRRSVCPQLGQVFWRRYAYQARACHAASGRFEQQAYCRAIAIVRMSSGLMRWSRPYVNAMRTWCCPVGMGSSAVIVHVQISQQRTANIQEPVYSPELAVAGAVTSIHT